MFESTADNKWLLIPKCIPYNSFEWVLNEVRISVDRHII